MAVFRRSQRVELFRREQDTLTGTYRIIKPEQPEDKQYKPEYLRTYP